MLRTVVRVAALLLGIGCGSTALAQQPAPAPPPAAAPVKEPSLIDRLKEPDQGGGLHLTEHVAVVFGGIKSGSGIALGPALSYTFADGAYAQVKAVYSVKKFYVVQARFDTRKFWDGRALVTSRLRLQDAPKLKLYRLGPDAPDLRVDFGERKIEGSARLRAQLRPTVRIGTGVGFEKYSTDGGRIDVAFPETLPPVAPLPGLGTRPVFAHTFFSAALDSRTSPDYSRTGRWLEAAVHHYRDVRGDQDSFGRFDGAAQQLIPTHGGTGVIDLSVQTWLSLSDDPSVPFYLMPTLGGSNYLKAYPSYRFRDRHALLLKGEYRWAVHKMIDVAGLIEAGTVSSTVKGLELSNMAESIAAGIRVHTAKAGLVDLDVAHGRDGFKFTIGFNAGGS